MWLKFLGFLEQLGMEVLGGASGDTLEDQVEKLWKNAEHKGKIAVFERLITNVLNEEKYKSLANAVNKVLEELKSSNSAAGDQDKKEKKTHSLIMMLAENSDWRDAFLDGLQEMKAYQEIDKVLQYQVRNFFEVIILHCIKLFGGIEEKIKKLCKDLLDNYMEKLADFKRSMLNAIKEAKDEIIDTLGKRIGEIKEVCEEMNARIAKLEKSDKEREELNKIIQEFNNKIKELEKEKEKLEKEREEYKKKIEELEKERENSKEG